MERATRRVEHGSVVVIDYGVARTAELAMRPWRSWLRTYRANERGEHYLARPGMQDITIDVPFDQLPDCTTVRTQAQFLELHGIGDLVEAGRHHWAAHGARPDLEAMRRICNG